MPRPHPRCKCEWSRLFPRAKAGKARRIPETPRSTSASNHECAALHALSFYLEYAPHSGPRLPAHSCKTPVPYRRRGRSGAESEYEIQRGTAFTFERMLRKCQKILVTPSLKTSTRSLTPAAVASSSSNCKGSSMGSCDRQKVP